MCVSSSLLKLNIVEFKAIKLTTKMNVTPKQQVILREEKKVLLYIVVSHMHQTPLLFLYI